MADSERQHADDVCPGCGGDETRHETGCPTNYPNDDAQSAEYVAPPSLFQQGRFELHSGEVSFFKIDCDALSDEDIRTLAMMLAQRLPPFGTVEGVPSGGLRLADALRVYARPGPQRRGSFGAKELLIVDDVWTTGGSMEAHRAGRDALGAVIFARRETADWVTPLFTLDGTHIDGPEDGAV